MSSNATPLLVLQRDFMSAIREPIYGGSRELTALPARGGESSARFFALVENEIVSTPTLQSRERLELYHRQYWFRLLDSIEEDFPALQRLLGKEKFWRLIEAYLELVPSRSYTLRHLGSGLAAFLQINPGLAGGYPVHAVELARLEYALCEIVEASRRPAVCGDSLAHVTLDLQPHLRLFAFHTAADALWKSDDAAAIPPELLTLPSTKPSHHVAAFRHAGQIQVLRLPPNGYLVLEAIRQTGSLVTALESLEFSDADVNTVSDWFQCWTEFAWLCEREGSDAN